MFVGVLGGFTTFSTFGPEPVTLFRTGAPVVAMLNIATQLIGSLLAVYVGFIAAEPITGDWSIEITLWHRRRGWDSQLPSIENRTCFHNQA